MSFKNTVIIMTSNIGSQLILEVRGTDEHTYQRMREQVMDTLRRHFRPEFLNRVDEVVVFRALTEAEPARIVEITGEHLGDVEGVDLDPASRRITRVRVRKGRRFPAETAIPADVIASVDDDRITRRVRADVVKALAPVERSATPLGPSDTLPVRP